MRQALILIPGLLCTAALWRSQIGHLSDIADITVADHTGHDSMADLARAILDKAPERFALAGLSMGGYIALEIMRQDSKRVSRLALMDSNARRDTPQQSDRRRSFIEIARRGRFLGISRRMLEDLVHPDHVEDRGIGNTVVKMARETGREAFIRQQTAIINRIDSRPYLPRIDCPTLVLCGRQDKLTPLELHEEMTRMIRDARLEVVEHCGHLPPLEQPEAVNQALRDWLTEGERTS